jgi:hypothetical protein
MILRPKRLVVQNQIWIPPQGDIGVPQMSVCPLLSSAAPVKSLGYKIVILYDIVTLNWRGKMLWFIKLQP